MKTDMVDWPADYSDPNDPDNQRGRFINDIHAAIGLFQAYEEKYPYWAYEDYDELVKAHTRIHMLLDKMYRRRSLTAELRTIDRGV